MPDHQYVAWFRDARLPPDSQDHEWPACFVVVAPNEGQAVSWADELCRGYAARTHQTFLRSYIDPEEWGSTVPRVVAGANVGDDDIGW